MFYFFYFKKVFEPCFFVSKVGTNKLHFHATTMVTTRSKEKTQTYTAEREGKAHVSDALKKAREKEFRRLFYPDMLPPLSFYLNPPPLFRQ